MNKKKSDRNKTEQKLREYIKNQIIKIFKENDDEKSNVKKSDSKEKSEKGISRKNEYQKFFSQALAKFGYSSPASMPDEKKREFFDYIDANWTSKQEELKTEQLDVKFNVGDVVKMIKPSAALSGHWKLYNELKNQTGKIEKVIDDERVMVRWSNGALYNMKIKGLTATELKETSSTAGIAGYETPFAFTGKKGISKKQKNIANQLGYELVDKSYTKKEETEELNENSTKNFKNNELRKKLYDELQNIFQEHSHDISPYGTYEGYGEWGIIESEFDSVINDILQLLYDEGILNSKLNEGLDSYYFKDENLTSEQKLGLAMRHVRNNLNEIEKVVQRAIKMKNEENIDISNVGKRTYSALRRINEKVVKLMVALQGLK